MLHRKRFLHPYNAFAYGIAPMKATSITANLSFLVPWRMTMRFLAFVSVLAVMPALTAAGDKDAKPISPEVAAKKINEQCTVEFQVLSVGTSNGAYFLNSKEDFRDKDNFTVFINKEGADSLKKAKIEDPVAHFKGKTVQVNGTVKLYKDRPEIILEKAEQIKVVEKSEKK
jgi:DNA/RNA endonuclease YhcR with UshA esterase domain